MIRENNRFFHEKIIKSYISMIIERLVNAFDEFVKKIKQINMTIFDINVYWNVTSNTFVTSNSTFKSFILISGFATFRSFEEFDVNIRMRSQSVERFKRITQQILKKLNFERSWIDSSSDQFMKNWRKNQWFWWFRRRDCLFEMIVRADCLISWRLSIVIKRRLLTEKRNVCHKMNSALSILFLLFLYWTSVLFRSFIYTSASITFRP